MVPDSSVGSTAMEFAREDTGRSGSPDLRV